MSVKLLTEYHLELLSFNGGCTGSSVSTLVKMPHCLKSHVAAQLLVPVVVSVNQLSFFSCVMLCVVCICVLFRLRKRVLFCLQYPV